MAESIVQVNSGTGPKLHTFQRTIGANNVEDEVVLQGENYLASYILPTAAAVAGGMSTATANSHILQITAGASLKVRIRRIELHQGTMATAAALMSVVLVRLSTAGTGGTGPLGGASLDSTDAASGFAGMALPTVKGTETTVVSSARPYMMQTIAASSQLGNPIAVWDFDRPRSKPLIIPAGTANGLAIKNITAIAAGTVDVVVWADESSF